MPVMSLPVRRGRSFVEQAGHCGQHRPLPKARRVLPSCSTELCAVILMSQRKSRRPLIDRKALPVLLFWGMICYLLYKADPTFVPTSLHLLEQLAEQSGLHF